MSRTATVKPSIPTDEFKETIRIFWLLHKAIKVWNLEDGRFNRLGAYAAGDTFTSRTLGETVQVGDIFKE